ncbi:MAG: S9 family peptidase [Flavobacteriaceae bacterium]|jgi:oligopeptidase B|nr:S9 family peptidase [Flavobacteriaceae bacterium]MBT4231772.1 S9 family peptidase [Flavobacteriaceae bacterium]MBT5393321.1 S9 family peptidase [Flavobacteriaceae bacterium]MBT7575315.1 S9 family peptidase [Flavobacteriaceae bacterium]MBT7984708.1 S9 family peptidase [Flavobacteriaceae bacterium]
MIKNSIFLFVSIMFVFSCNNEIKPNLKNSIIPPKAEKIPVSFKKFNDIRIDDYYWLKERDNPEVIDYLERENDYYEKMTSHTLDLQDKLFNEIKNKIKEDDESVPYFLNGYWYKTKYEEGLGYPIYTRYKDSLSNKEEILFNCNELAEKHDYFNLSNFQISPDNKIVAYSIDTVSRRLYTIQFKNLETGEIYNDKIINSSGSFAWANDNSTLFYTNRDVNTLRNDKIFKHKLGTDYENDELIYFENDETFYTNVSKSKSKKYIIISSYSTLTSEFQFLPADSINKDFKLFNKRKRGVEYSINHYDDHFFIITNKDNAYNYKLMKTEINKTSSENWTDVIEHRKNILIEGIDIFKDHLVVSERVNGLNRINIKKWDDSENYFLNFDNETFSANTTTNLDFDSKKLRYAYNSLNEPYSVVEFDMTTKEKIILKQHEVLDKKFNKNNYVTERIWADSKDGNQIPISLIYKKGIKKDGSNPLLLYGYGSYGNTIDPSFSISRLSLLDRGFIYAIAHVRGSEYLGRDWYEQGKLLNKKNSFNDFVDTTKFLISKGYTSSKHCYAYGGSAGGLLMGAVLNIAPELYNGVIAAVPFVDVITTMLDETIPLTTSEYDEWGNPNQKQYYNYMMSYSPYDNVSKVNYPNLLVTTGLHDSQVQYWEPAKWVAKLRDYKLDKNYLFLNTNMETGHGGSSGRFEAIKDLAKEYAFILDLENIYD